MTANLMPPGVSDQGPVLVRSSTSKRPRRLSPRERWSDEQFVLGPDHDVLRDRVSSELHESRQIMSSSGRNSSA